MTTQQIIDQIIENAIDESELINFDIPEPDHTTSEREQDIRLKIACMVMDRMSYVNAQDVLERSILIRDWVMYGDSSFNGYDVLKRQQCGDESTRRK